MVAGGDALSDLVGAARARNPNHEGWLSGSTHLHVSAEGMMVGKDQGRVWMLNVERLQRESRRR